jgi:3-keto-L-gulonate-6-phosphate decarboxylase
MTVGIDRKRADRGNTLTDDAFKRGADLAAQQR